MATDVSRTVIKNIAALTATIDTQIPADGEEWLITEFKHWTNPNQDTHCRLVWDYQGPSEEILALGHGDGIQVLNKNIIGDGVKKLALIVQNDTAGLEYIGGAYLAYK